MRVPRPTSTCSSALVVVEEIDPRVIGFEADEELAPGLKENGISSHPSG